VKPNVYKIFFIKVTTKFNNKLAIVSPCHRWRYVLFLHGNREFSIDI